MKEHDRGSGFRGLTGVEDDATVRVAHLPVPLHGGGCPGRSGEETQASGPPHHAPSGATKEKLPVSQSHGWFVYRHRMPGNQ